MFLVLEIILVTCLVGGRICGQTTVVQMSSATVILVTRTLRNARKGNCANVTSTRAGSVYDAGTKR